MIAEKDMAALKAELEARLAEIEALDEATREARRPVEFDQQSVGRLARMDAMQQQAMAVATERRRQIEHRKIEAALKRMEEGEYGVCTHCGEDIPLERLQLDPAVAFCLPCMRGEE